MLGENEILLLRYGATEEYKKKLYMKRDFNVIIEKDEEGFYIASVPALKGCHTQAKSLDVLMERIKEAIELCLEEKEAF